MYLHLGQGAVVTRDSIIGIFDLDNTTSSHITRDFLNRTEKAGRVLALGEELPKSFVVVKDEIEDAVYLSQLSPATLAKRGEGSGIE